MRIVNKILWLLLTIGHVNLYGQSQIILNDTIMDKRIDFNLLEERAEKTPLAGENQYQYSLEYEDTDGSVCKIFGNKTNGFVEWQTPPNPVFLKIYKEYYPNGYLKVKGKRLRNGATLIGEWEYYNENGQLTSTVDEDKKFGKFGYNELYLFLHQQKYINIETGENREKVSFGYNIETKQWSVTITGLGYWMTEYLIDGETGEILNKKESQGGIE